MTSQTLTRESDQGRRGFLWRASAIGAAVVGRDLDRRARRDRLPVLLRPEVPQRPVVRRH